MIYGTKAEKDGNHILIVTAADTFGEYEMFTNNKHNCLSYGTLDAIEMMTDPFWNDMVRPPFIMTFATEAELNEYASVNFSLLPPMKAIDRQIEMFAKKKEMEENEKVERAKMLAEQMGEEYRGKTIGEITGTDINDQWELKDTEAIQGFRADNQLKENSTNGSFGSADAIKMARDKKEEKEGLHYDAIRATQDEDGVFRIGHIHGHKHSSKEEQEEKDGKEESTSLFNDDDFDSFEE